MNKYLEGIKHSNDSILKEIYQNHYNPLKHFVLSNNGNEEDAKDVFQEALISIFKRLKKEDFEITTNFGSYFYTAGKYIWYRKLKNSVAQDHIEDFEFKAEIGKEYAEEARYILFRNNLSKLGVDCQKVLNYYFEKKSFKEIAKLMTYKSEDYARRKKYLCTKTLIKKVRLDPMYKQIKAV